MVLISITDPPHNTETLHIPVHSSLNGADLGKDGRREVPLAGKCPQWIIITRGLCPLCLKILYSTKDKSCNFAIIVSQTGEFWSYVTIM